MQIILSSTASELLAGIARERSLLVLGFDGTLAPLSGRHQDAALREETRALLRVVALLYPCAVLSGRTRADLVRRLDGIPLVAAVGCHGADPGFGPLDPDLLRRVAGWRPILEAAVRDCEGVELEDRRLGLALHSRGARSPRAAEQRALELARRVPDAVVLPGDGVVSLVPPGAPTKADAVAALCRRLGVGGAVYLGDDATDEEAFRSPFVGTSIRIGASRDSAAAYGLECQAQLDALLRGLVDARARLDGRAAPLAGVIHALGAPGPGRAGVRRAAP